MVANDDLSETSWIKYIQINVREHGRDNKKGTIQRKWQHCGHKTQDEDKQQQKTHHYIQTNSDNVNKTSYTWST